MPGCLGKSAAGRTAAAVNPPPPFSAPPHTETVAVVNVVVTVHVTVHVTVTVVVTVVVMVTGDGRHLWRLTV